jgi:hypothetical protein
MILDIASGTAPTRNLRRSQRWSEAQFTDQQMTDGLIVRAVVCPLQSGGWQWTVSSLDRFGGEVISVGVETSAAKARLTAASEIEKCIEDPIERT